jgi:type II secretory pathway component PulK
MIGKKSQVVIISLWILVILTILAISVAHRVAMALRLSRYQRDKIRALYLAKAGINRAIAELEKDKDNNNYDALNEKWADNKDTFEKILLNNNPDEFATVSYTVEENGKEETQFGMIDEERKININEADSGLLLTLLSKIGVSNSSEIANNICAWRGGKDFTNIAELILVKGLRDIDLGIYEKLKNLITVWGSGKVNINTADRYVLEILMEYCRKQLQNQNISENNPGDLAERVIQLRPFDSIGDLQTKLTNQGSLDSSQINILNELYKVIDFKSACFYIRSNGKIGNSNLGSKIYCIFDRDKKNITYWHES